jgi:hypothetical protein
VHFLHFVIKGVIMNQETKQLVKEITNILIEQSTSTEMLALSLAIYILEREKKTLNERLNNEI